MEAAERRRVNEASRGVKDPEKVLRAQQRQEEMEKREQELAKEGGATLKVHFLVLWSPSTMVLILEKIITIVIFKVGK